MISFNDILRAEDIDPATVSTFDPNNVTSLIYGLDTSGGC
jgi:hypothetical protein